MAWYEQAARGGCVTNSPLRALLLEVTAEIANIERYRVLDDSYVYPTIAELKEIAAPDFHIHQCDIPNYPHGQHFPRLILEKKM